MKKSISTILISISFLSIVILSCEKKVYAPGVENQDGSSTSSTGSTTSSSTTGGTTSGSTTGGTTSSSTTGGTTGTSNGEVSFYLATDHGCGTVTVVVNGVSKYLTSYFSSGAPTCGQSGTATFSLPPGTYTYSASCTGYYWPGPGYSNQFTVTSNGCLTKGLI